MNVHQSQDTVLCFRQLTTVVKSHRKRFSISCHAEKIEFLDPSLMFYLMFVIQNSSLMLRWSGILLMFLKNFLIVSQEFWEFSPRRNYVQLKYTGTKFLFKRPFMWIHIENIHFTWKIISEVVGSDMGSFHLSGQLCTSSCFT